MRQSKIQERVESYWHHQEQERAMHRRRTCLDLSALSSNKGEKTMVEIKNSRWSIEDLNKLSSNRHQPINQLRLIFKGKFLEDEIRYMLLELDRDKRPKSKGRASTMTPENFKILYDNRGLTLKDLTVKYPELTKRMTDLTIGWYRSCIRAELKGIKTSLSKRFYDLLVIWVKDSTSKDIPPRGSAGDNSAKARRERRKNGFTPQLVEAQKCKALANQIAKTGSNSAPDPLREPIALPGFNSAEAESKVEISTPAQEKQVSIENTPEVESTPSLSVNIPKINQEVLSSSGVSYWGVQIGTEIKAVSLNEDFVNGAFSVYASMGLSCRKIKLILDNI